MHNENFWSELLIRLRTGIILVLIIFGAIYFLPCSVFIVLVNCLGIYISWIEWPRIMPRTLIPAFFCTLFCIIYPLYSLIMLFCTPQTNPYVAPLFFVLFAHDSGAYIAGKFFGKHQLAPAISPGKTWEGFFGGCMSVLCALFFLSFIYSAKYSFSWYALILLTLVISVIATAGDLFESYLKRKSGYKDTGSLLPGHGGLLDRCDSIFACAAFFWTYYILVGI